MEFFLSISAFFHSSVFDLELNLNRSNSTNIGWLDDRPINLDFRCLFFFKVWWGG